MTKIKAEIPKQSTDGERCLWQKIVEIRAKLGDTRWGAALYADRIVEAYTKRSLFWLRIVKIRAKLGDTSKGAIEYADRVVESFEERQ